ncbi:hypothetical protein JB92DRAFT_3135248 [Gautieria morchelliformis]|nr:hypothetical protein JB92DRAFT_3135248 [Gautieria morchelliformis]
MDTELRVYHRDFPGIAAYLITNKQLSEKDAARIVKPDHPREDPFVIKDVYKAGCYIFNSNTFNRTPILSAASPIQSSSVKSQGASGESKVSKRTVQLPEEQPADIGDLLEKLRGFKVNDKAYATTYFQLLSKQPSYINVLKTPAAYALTPSNRQYTPHLPPIQPNQGNQGMQACPFCKVTNCAGHTPKECPIGQDYVRQGKVIVGEHVFYRWPDGSRILNDPRGIKFLVDQAQTTRSQDGAVAFLQVEPVEGEGVIHWSERGDDVVDDCMAQERMRGAYLAMVSTKEASPRPSDSASKEGDRKIPQYQSKSKCDDANAVQRVFE